MSEVRARNDWRGADVAPRQNLPRDDSQRIQVISRPSESHPIQSNLKGGPQCLKIQIIIS